MVFESIVGGVDFVEVFFFVFCVWVKLVVLVWVWIGNLRIIGLRIWGLRIWVGGFIISVFVGVV